MREISLTIEETARKAVGFILPVFFATGIPFFVLHGWQPFQDWSWMGFFVFLGSVFLGVPFHELLHALIFGMFARGGYKSIRLGVERRTYTPYCHCTAPIRVQYYRLGALMPLLILGLAPFVVSLLTGSFGFWLFGFIFSIGAGGDLVAIEMLKKIPGHKKVQDHPEKMGFFVLD